VEVRVGTSARAAEGLRLAGHAWVLVLSGHAFRDPLAPHRSGILLAGGPLTVANLLRVVLPGTIVIVAGCSTAAAVL
jgi:hypothetical protein